MPFISYTSPVGPLSLFQDGDHLVALDWGWPPSEDPTPLLERAQDQLAAYFAGELRRFDLPVHPHGTTFQQRVWQAIAEIPWGHVVTYGQLAAQLGSSPRAVGGALGRNPIPIIIPCHRVIGTNGGLGGYSGWDGVETKQALLKREGVQL